MGEIYVKKNDAFERVVSDGNTVIVTGGGGGGGGGVTIAFSARRGPSTVNPHLNAGGTPGTNNGPPSSYPSGSTTISLCDAGWGVGLTSAYTESWNYGVSNLLQGKLPTSNVFQVARTRHISKQLLNNVEVNESSLGSQPYNSEQGVFTAPVDGVYEFSANASMYHLSAAGENNNNLVMGMLWIQKANSSGTISTVSTSSALGTVLIAREVEPERDDHNVQVMSGSWIVKLTAGEKVGLCARVEWGDNGNTIEPCRSVSFSEVSFSGSYVGGASVTPVGPQACFVKSNGIFTPNQGNPGSGVPGSITQISGNSGASLTKLIDTLNEFDVSLGKFTAKTKGIYSVNLSAIGLDASFGTLTVWMQKTLSGQSITPNSSSAYGGLIRENEYLYGGNSGEGINTMSKTWLVDMEVGDVLTWYVIANNIAAATPNVPPGPHQKMSEISISAHLLTSTQTINTSPVAMYSSISGTLNSPTAFRLRNSSSPPVTLTELVDTNQYFNPTTGVFTAPVGGVYSISCGGEVQDQGVSAYASMWIRKVNAGSNATSDPTNGSASRYGQIIRVSNATNTETAHMSGEWLVELGVGDQVTWYGEGNDNRLQNMYISAKLQR